MENILKKVTDGDIVNGYYTIQDGVTKIGFRSFEGCKSLKNVDIPDSVTEIEDWAFLCCKSLKKVSLPKGIKLCEEVFLGCPPDLKIEYR